MIQRLTASLTPLVATLARTLNWLVPAVGALAAVLAIVPWGLGIPGHADATYADGWWRGALAILGYLTVYGLACILWLAARIVRLPVLATLGHVLAWGAFCVAAATLYIALRMIFELA